MNFWECAANKARDGERGSTGFCTACPLQGCGGAGADPSWCWASGGVHNEQVASQYVYIYNIYIYRQTSTHIHHLESPINSHVFGRRTGKQANSTQKGPSWPLGSNPEPSCCEATGLATAPPRHPSTGSCITIMVWALIMSKKQLKKTVNELELPVHRVTGCVRLLGDSVPRAGAVWWKQFSGFLCSQIS